MNGQKCIIKNEAHSNFTRKYCLRISGKRMNEIKTHRLDAPYVHIELGASVGVFSSYIPKNLDSTIQNILEDMSYNINKLQELYFKISKYLLIGNLKAISTITDVNIFDELSDFSCWELAGDKKRLIDALEDSVSTENYSEDSKERKTDILDIASFFPDSVFERKSVVGEKQKCLKDLLLDIYRIFLHDSRFKYIPEHNWLFGGNCKNLPDITMPIITEGQRKEYPQTYIDLLDRLLIRLQKHELEKLSEDISDNFGEDSIVIYDRFINQTHLVKNTEILDSSFQKSNMATLLHFRIEKPRVFICYAQSDGENIRNTILRDIKSYNKNIEVLTDKRLQPGSQWLPVLSHMIDLADVIVVIVTDDALTHQLYWTGFIRNYEAGKIQYRTNERLGGRTFAKLRFVDATNQYKDSELVKHVYGDELSMKYYNGRQRTTASEDSYSVFSPGDLENLFLMNSDTGSNSAENISLEKIEKSAALKKKVEKHAPTTIPPKTLLEKHFRGIDRNANICAAYSAGHTQKDIAEFCNLSPSSVSRIVREQKKVT